MIQVLDVRASRRAIVAGSVGNFIEWYDFAAYGYFATTLAVVFFPGEDPVAAQLSVWAGFAVAFFFRPLGAAVFGRIGDRIGRRPTLIVILTLMALATTAIGLLPSFAAAGILAPILLVLCRILQGLSAGGEFGGAVSLMVEYAPEGRRGRYGSWQSFTVGLGLLAGVGLATVLSSTLSEPAMQDWGWRVPFLIGAPLGLVALYLRLKVDETPKFAEVRRRDPEALGTPARSALLTVLFAIGTILVWTCAGNVFLVVMPAYLETVLEVPQGQSLLATFAANAAFTVTIPVAGILSDRLGRKAVMLTATVGIVVLAYPLFLLLGTDGVAIKMIALLIAGVLVGALAGPGPAMLAELFPTTVRFTGLALGYSLSTAVFGGTAPFIVTWLTDTTGDSRAAAYYAIAGGLVSVVCLSRLRRDAHVQPLRDV